jgi:hypothetical protein
MFMQLTRPDDTPVAIRVSAVLKVAPVPTSGATAGPLKSGVRILLQNGDHQDVKESFAAVMAKLGT